MSAKYIGLSNKASKKLFGLVKIVIGPVKNLQFFYRFYRQCMVKMKFISEKARVEAVDKYTGYEDQL